MICYFKGNGLNHFPFYVGFSLGDIKVLNNLYGSYISVY